MAGPFYDDESYSLIGTLAADAATQSLPRPGEAWVETALLTHLGLQVGDAVEVGAHTLTITRLLTFEPGQGGGRFGIIGGIEPTNFLNLSLDELGPYVECQIAEAAGGPFVLANGDSCPPGVTMEKFKLVGDVVRATGG